MDSSIDPPFASRARTWSGPGWSAMSPMRLLSVITLGYLVVAAVFLYAAGTNPLYLLLGVLRTFPSFLGLAAKVTPTWLLVSVLAAIFATPYLRRRIRANITEILLIAVYSSLFTLVFGLVKNHLPAVIPFWADPMFTRLDAAMTPRGLVTWMDRIDTGLIQAIYFNLWVLMAAFFPMIMAIADPDNDRRRLFTLLWAACWIGLGNLLAAAFMSAGPIFLDRLPGGDPSLYPDVFALLARPEAAPLADIKARLWSAYSEGEFMVGSGISAFPSVHVGMATVIALYLSSVLGGLARTGRGSRFGTAARIAAIAFPVALVGIYQLVTVYTGMHYAIDGYASIAIILVLHRLTAGRARAGAEAAAPAGPDPALLRP